MCDIMISMDLNGSGELERGRNQQGCTLILSISIELVRRQVSQNQFLDEP